MNLSRPKNGSAAKLLSIVASLVALAMITPAPAHGETSDTLLASFVFTGEGAVDGAPTWQPFLSYGDPDAPASVLINNATLDFTSCVQGDTGELTGDFAEFSALASDGVDQPLLVGFGVPGGTGSEQLTSESALLAGASSPAAGVGTPDFAGYVLTRIVVLCSAFQTSGDGTFETTINFVVFGMPTVDAVIAQVDSFDLPAGLDNALTVKLQHALDAIQDGDLASACSALDSFKSQVSAQSGKKLTTDQASELLQSAALLSAQIGCS